MKWTEIPTGQTNGAFQRLMVAFGDRADSIVERINADEAVAPRVATLCYHNGYEPSVSQEKARKIMSKNFFGIEDVQKHFGVTFSKRQLAYMAEIPFSEEVLTECKDTHILVAYAPMAIVAVRTKTASVKLPPKHRMFYQQDWYDNNEVGNGAGALEWHLVRKTSVPESKSKTWQEQQDLLDHKIDETPEANVMVYTIIGHFLATGERLFEKEYVRTRTLDSDGDRVLVGYFDAYGLYIVDWSGDGPSGYVGLSVARKQ
ncbi:MAG: hypothetical protein Q7S61_05575 [bacterium]|nr:hypothetical protein [bacterium]